MNKILLIVGAVIHLFFGVNHIGLGLALGGPSPFSSLDPEGLATVLTLNMAVTVTCLIFAYLSFFHRNEVPTTKLGAGVLAGIAAFWIVRGAAQVVFYGLTAPGTLIWVVICLLVALLYVVPMFGGRRVAVPAVTA